MKRTKEQEHLYEEILKYIEHKKTIDGVRYIDAIIEVNDIVKNIEKSINKALDNVCCICGKPIEGFGNNPFPIKKEGRCCDDCNLSVIRERIRRANLV